MFDYSDPTDSGTLLAVGAIGGYRSLLHGLFRHFGRFPRSGFTIPEAFDEVSDPAQVQTAQVNWLAFPRAAQASAEQIDSQRFRHQDEYVEWRTERNAAGRVTRVTFTTEFSEYYEALAATSVDGLLAEIRKVTGVNTVTSADVFGPGFNPLAATPQGRANRLLERAEQNPWNNGSQSILFLTHGSSTLGALLHLAAACGVSRPTVAAGDTCAAVSGACVSTRNSDPAVCSAVQDLARNANSFTLADPAGITIEGLQGIWKRAGKQVDINASGLWRVQRNRRRATLTVPQDLSIVDDPITTGTAVAARLMVGAKVIFAPDTVLPEWSRMGQESSRMLTD